jgi:NTE family protein
VSRKKVGLALSGGAARGIAHIGVIQVLERAKIEVDCVAGTSAGSVVGAAYAAGIGGDRLAEMALAIHWRDFARRVWPRTGFVSFAPLESYIAKVAGDLTFADLTIPYAAVAAELDTGQPVILQEGRVAPAIRASCSVPGLVTPMELDGRLLVDGGVVNNLPISVVRDLGADIVIAVDLIGPLGRRPKGIGEILTVTLETLLARAADDPATADVYILIPVRGFRSFYRLSAGKQLIAAGRHAAEEVLPAIRAVLD